MSELIISATVLIWLFALIACSFAVCKLMEKREERRSSSASPYPIDTGKENMGAVLDTVTLGPSELLIIKGKYPECVIQNLTSSKHLFQEYRVIIPNEDETNYYDFLVKNHIALSSHKFHSRLKSDRDFEKRMRSKIGKRAVED